MYTTLTTLIARERQHFAERGLIVRDDIISVVSRRVHHATIASFDRYAFIDLSAYTARTRKVALKWLTDHGHDYFALSALYPHHYMIDLHDR
jgi:hypothetical protein